MTNDTRFCHRLSIRRSHHQKIVTHTNTNPILSFHPVSTIHPAVQQKRRTFEKCITIDSLCGHRYQSFRSVVALLFIHFRSIFSKTRVSVIFWHTTCSHYFPPKMCFEIFTTFISFKKMMIIIGGIFKRHPDRYSGSRHFPKVASSKAPPLSENEQQFQPKNNRKASVFLYTISSPISDMSRAERLAAQLIFHLNSFVAFTAFCCVASSGNNTRNGCFLQLFPKFTLFPTIMC